MSDQNNKDQNVLLTVVNAIEKDEREALKKSLRGKVSDYRKALKVADDIRDDIIADLKAANAYNAEAAAALFGN